MSRSKGKAPNISGSFQVVDDERKESVEELRQSSQLDEETEYYARIFMED